jgi:hypothetical protein
MELDTDMESFSREDHVEHLANMLDEITKEAYVQQRNVLFDKQHFFSYTMDVFKNDYIEFDNPRNITFTEVLNCNTYSRYFGTFANIIEMMVFDPRHLIWGGGLVGNVEDTNKQYDNHLCDKALHDILHTTFKLITDDGLDVQMHDYYNMKPLQHIMSYYADCKNTMPSSLRAFLRPFYILFRDGAMIVKRPQAAVRAFLQRQKGLRAISTIDEGFSELVI